MRCLLFLQLSQKQFQALHCTFPNGITGICSLNKCKKVPESLQLVLQVCWLIYNIIYNRKEFYTGQTLASSSHLKINFKLDSSGAVFSLFNFFLKSFLFFSFEKCGNWVEKKMSKLFQNLLKDIQISPRISVLGFSFAELWENSQWSSKYLHRSQKESYMYLNIYIFFTMDLKTG